MAQPAAAPAHEVFRKALPYEAIRLKLSFHSRDCELCRAWLLPLHAGI
jgi:hypothetical protein